jgi:hypothetical protein
MKSLLALLFVATISAPQPPATPRIAIPDCSTWKEIRSEPAVQIPHNKVVIQSADFFIAHYVGSKGEKCSRFFFKSKKLTIGQSWENVSGKSFAYLLLPDNTKYVAPNAIIMFKALEIDVYTSSQGKLAIGIFENEILTKSRLYEIEITVVHPTPRQSAGLSFG